jgi:hypothetical protein
LNSFEIILRLDIKPTSSSWGAAGGGDFNTDNGVELIYRKRDIVRFNDTALRSIITGNYYPAQSMDVLIRPSGY